MVVRDRTGRVLATASVPPLKAPSDLMPKTADAALDLPANAERRVRHPALRAGREAALSQDD